MKNELLKITGNRPWVSHPHTIAQKIDPSWKPFNYLVETSRLFVTEITSKNARIIFSCHPRIGKTTLSVLYLIIWHLNLWPSKHVIFFTYGEEFSTERCRLVRDTILQNSKYLNVSLTTDNRSASMFTTHQGGGLRGLGVGQGLAGLPCNLAVIDDVFSSWAKAQNARERKKVISWFGEVYSRLSPGGSIVLCGNRTHYDDLQGYLLRHHPDKWLNLTYPALSLGADVDSLKRPKGKALSPVLFDEAALHKIRLAIGKQKWSSQYQQSPEAKEIESGPQAVFPEEIISRIGNSHLPRFDQTKSNNEENIHYIAIDVGKKYSHTAIVISRVVGMGNPKGPELHIIGLKQFPLNTIFREIVQELVELSFSSKFGQLAPVVLLDSSGHGGGISTELLGEKIKPILPITILSTGTSRDQFRVPKQLLIQNFVDFILSQRLKICDKLNDQDLLIKELQGYRSQSSPQGRTTKYRTTGGAGTDDLLDCLALCTWAVEKKWNPRYAQQGEKIYPHSLPKRRPISGNRGPIIHSNLSRSLYAERNPEFSSWRGWR